MEHDGITRWNNTMKHFCTYWLATVPTSAGTGACLQNGLVPDGGSPPAQWCSIPTPAGVSAVRPSTPTVCAPGAPNIDTSVSIDRIGHGSQTSNITTTTPTVFQACLCTMVYSKSQHEQYQYISSCTYLACVLCVEVAFHHQHPALQPTSFDVPLLFLLAQLLLQPFDL